MNAPAIFWSALFLNDDALFASPGVHAWVARNDGFDSPLRGLCPGVNVWASEKWLSRDWGFLHPYYE